MEWRKFCDVVGSNLPLAGCIHHYCPTNHPTAVDTSQLRRWVRRLMSIASHPFDTLDLESGSSVEIYRLEHSGPESILHVFHTYTVFFHYEALVDDITQCCIESPGSRWVTLNDYGASDNAKVRSIADVIDFIRQDHQSHKHSALVFDAVVECCHDEHYQHAMKQTEQMDSLDIHPFPIDFT